MKEIFYDWYGLNAKLFLFFNDFHTHWTDAFMMAVTEIADYRHVWIYGILLFAYVFYLTKKLYPYGSSNGTVLNWYLTLSRFVIGYLIEMAVVSGLKAFFDYPRPLKVLGETLVYVVGHPQYLHSFPSGHSAFAAFFAATLWPVMNRIDRCAVVIFVGLVMLSRMVLGAHFPMDVLTGATVGAFCAIGVRHFAQPVVKTGANWIMRAMSAASRITRKKQSSS